MERRYRLGKITKFYYLCAHFKNYLVLVQWDLMFFRLSNTFYFKKNAAFYA